MLVLEICDPNETFVMNDDSTFSGRNHEHIEILHRTRMKGGNIFLSNSLASVLSIVEWFYQISRHCNWNYLKEDLVNNYYLYCFIMAACIIHGYHESNKMLSNSWYIAKLLRKIIIIIWCSLTKTIIDWSIKVTMLSVNNVLIGFAQGSKLHASTNAN